MSDPQKQFLALYRVCRQKDQVNFYKMRIEEFEKARSQAIYLAAILMALTAIASLTATELFGPKWAAVLSVFLPTLATALTAYNSLYSFETQSKLYRDAVSALGETEEIGADAEQATGAEAEVKITAYVNQVEAIFHKEQSQWGQLTGETQRHLDEGG
ncbi:MAG: SLATT domain-containing protein [Chloracidobacterium sp.]|nr:SLATT domain-containing protein [Chloracidobacterium sp.]